ncbi:hypothetical protein OXX79_003471 [Metschnikowia pulcherrima]
MPYTDTLPPLTGEDLELFENPLGKCFVMPERINDKEDEFLLRSAAADESIIIMAMAFQWKGTSAFALQAIVRSIREFEAKFADVKHVCSPVAALMTILQNFTGPGKQMVEYWYKKNMERLATDPHTFIAEFITEILPALQMNNQVREKSAIHLPNALQMQYLAKLKSMGCTEDMFWSISETEETDAISEKSSETPLWKSGKRNHPNHALVCLLMALRENPHLCPNCLGEHKLSACTNISPRSVDNLAAWIIPSFGKLTGRKVHHEQREIARYVTSLSKRKEKSG